MDDVKAKQQVVDKIKESTNILITVSKNPSVDALSAAVGLTLLLDKLDKHATAVFSGTVPPALAFLEPEKILDDTTDSLRDFIIALDKEKADHLRYKVEGDSVKIFITPYKTTITSDDLQFSQGDYNVELVIALGVDLQEHLDSALETHGQILHDATVVTVTAGSQVSNLGGIDWHDDQASSLSEMVAGLTEAMKGDKNKTLLDKQIATAMLTGIVAQTDRFSNTHTTSRVMTIAAQLMAGGADQQLIASKLEGTLEIGDEPTGDSTPEPPKEEPKESLSISHKPNETLEELDKRVKAAEQAEAETVAKASLDEHTANASASGAYSIDHDAAPAEPEPVAVAEPIAPPVPTPPESLVGDAKAAGASAVEPTLGGTLNATSEQAAEDARREHENDQNKTILSHAYLSAPQGNGSLMNANEAAGSSFVLGQDRPQPGDEAPVQVPQPGPADLGLPMPPPVPDFSAAPPSLTAAYAPTPLDNQPERLGDILNDPTPPVTPTLGDAPQATITPPAEIPPVAPGPGDPGQFKIPGQQ
jgi:hypothetical protein